MCIHTDMMFYFYISLESSASSAAKRTVASPFDEIFYNTEILLMDMFSLHNSKGGDLNQH